MSPSRVKVTMWLHWFVYPRRGRLSSEKEPDRLLYRRATHARPCSRREGTTAAESTSRWACATGLTNNRRLNGEIDTAPGGPQAPLPCKWHLACGADGAGNPDHVIARRQPLGHNSPWLPRCVWWMSRAQSAYPPSRLRCRGLERFPFAGTAASSLRQSITTVRQLNAKTFRAGNTTSLRGLGERQVTVCPLQR